MAEHAISNDELFEALDYACAIAQEWDGEPGKVKAQLEALGLDPEAVRELLHERWEKYAPLFDPANPHLLFVQGFTEGLMTGAVLRRSQRYTGEDA